MFCWDGSILSTEVVLLAISTQRSDSKEKFVVQSASFCLWTCDDLCVSDVFEWYLKMLILNNVLLCISIYIYIFLLFLSYGARLPMTS